MQFIQVLPDSPDARLFHAHRLPRSAPGSLIRTPEGSSGTDRIPGGTPLPSSDTPHRSGAAP